MFLCVFNTIHFRDFLNTLKWIEKRGERGVSTPLSFSILHNQVRTSGFNVNSNPFCFRIPTSSPRISMFTNSLNFETDIRILHYTVENLIIAVNDVSIISLENDRTTSSTNDVILYFEGITIIHTVICHN